MGLKQFAAEIIEGPGGLNDFIEREMVVYSVSDKVFAAEWTIKCLANPRCEGSDVAVEAILKGRGIQDELDAVPSLRARLAAAEARVAELDARMKRIDLHRGERCECDTGECGPAEYADVEGVPLCAECWEQLCFECRCEEESAALRGEEVQGGK